MQKQNFGFTLVELIVVIVILGVLSTIGFVSYNGYLGGARDSNRISQLKNINDALNLYSTKNDLPTPDSYDSIYTNTNNLIGYQGYAGQNVLEIINYTNGGKDPKDDGYYTYYLSSDRKRVQLMGFLEEAENLQANIPRIGDQAQAADYTNRFPKVYGKKLGILTLAANNSPIQEDASFTTGEVYFNSLTANYNVYYSDTEKFLGTGTALSVTSPNASCKRLRESGAGTGNGLYNINPTGVSGAAFEVYCDMTTGGGGWTLIGSKVTTANQTKGAFGTVLVRQGQDKNVQITQTDFRNALVDAMACSSENCWTWSASSAFKTCLGSGCAATADTFNLKRVSGTTGTAVIAGTNVLYNIAAGAAFFDAYASATSGVGSPLGTTKRPMSGIGAVASWGPGEKWELYVR